MATFGIPSAYGRPIVRPPAVVPRPRGGAGHTTGAALTTPSQNGGGRGASFQQTGAATGTSVGQTSGVIAPTTITRPAPTPPPPAPPDLSGDKWMAYLTPDQRTTLLNAGTQAGSTVDAQQQREGQAQDAYTTTTADNQYRHDVNQSQINQEMAARGMFLSSERDNALTDLNRTLVDNNAAALSSLNSIITDATNQISNINTQYGQMILGAQGDAAAQVPVTTPPPAGPPQTITTPIPHPPSGPAAPRNPVRTATVGGHQIPTVGRGQIGYHGGF